MGVKWGGKAYCYLTLQLPSLPRSAGCPSLSRREFKCPLCDKVVWCVDTCKVRTPQLRRGGGGVCLGTGGVFEGEGEGGSV